MSRIQTKRLSLNPFSEQYLTEQYVAWLNDSELMRFSEQRHRSHTVETCRNYLQSFTDSPHFLWAIEEVESGLGHIGNINAYVDNHNGVADLGVVIGEKRGRGHGYALEAWQGVCQFFFQERGLRKISAGTLAVNKPMLHLMQQAGMLDDGVRKAHYVVEGAPVDLIHMALFRETRLGN